MAHDGYDPFAPSGGSERRVPAGRRRNHEVSVQQLLDIYQRYDAHCRLNRLPTLKREFCTDKWFDKTRPTLNLCEVDYGLVWPYIPRNRWVLLVDVDQPFEILFASDSLLAGLGFCTDELLHQPLHALNRAEPAPSAEFVDGVRTLQDADPKTAQPLHLDNRLLIHRAGTRQRVSVDIRYGRYSRTLYCQLLPIAEPLRTGRIDSNVVMPGWFEGFKPVPDEIHRADDEPQASRLLFGGDPRQTVLAYPGLGKRVKPRLSE